MSSVVVTKRVNRVVVTAPGPQGATGPTGPTGTALSGTPNKFLATDPTGSSTNPAALRELVDDDFGITLRRFPRIDVVQTYTPAELAALRGNMGNRRLWTVAELNALSDADSADIGCVWCSDAIALDRHFMAGNGAWVFWDYLETCWRTMRDGIPATNSFHEFTLHAGRQNRAPFVGPFSAELGDHTGGVTIGPFGYVNGTGSTITSAGSDPVGLSQIKSTPGSTSGGSARGVFMMNHSILNQAPIRDYGFCFGYRPTATAVSSGADTWHWRFGFTEPVFNSVTSMTSNEAVIMMDDQNTLGNGATGTTLVAFSRVNGVDVDWVDTTIDPASGAPTWFVFSFEPTGPSLREGRLRIGRAASGGASITPLVDRAVVWGGAITGLQATIMVAKTGGTGLRYSVRKSARVITRRRDNTPFTGEIE